MVPFSGMYDALQAKLDAAQKHIDDLKNRNANRCDQIRADAFEARQVAVAMERESCAKLAEEASSLFNTPPGREPTSEMKGMDAAANMRARSIAIAIRARGEL